MRQYKIVPRKSEFYGVVYVIKKRHHLLFWKKYAVHITFLSATHHMEELNKRLKK